MRQKRSSNFSQKQFDSAQHLKQANIHLFHTLQCHCDCTGFGSQHVFFFRGRQEGPTPGKATSTVSGTVC